MPQLPLNSIDADILFLTDCGPSIGMGHIIRCLSIAEQLEEIGLSFMFIVNYDCLESFDCKYTCIEWQKNINDIYLDESSVIFVDSYLADYDIKEKIYQRANKAAFYDDGNCLDFPGGYVFNGLSYARDLPYTNRQAKYYLGPEYLPARSEFSNCSQLDLKSDITNVFICVGSIDTNNVIPRMIRQLDDAFSGITINIVGKFFPDVASANCVHFYNWLSAREIKCLMEQASFAIGNGGQISVELAKLGIPSILYPAMDNQKRNVDFLFEKEAALSTGDDLELLSDCLKRIKKLSIRKMLSDNIYGIYRQNGSKKIAMTIKKEVCGFGL